MSNKPAYEELAQQVKDLTVELETLRSSEKFFQDLIQNSLDVIFTIDLKGGLRFRNEVAEKMTYIELSGDNAYHEEFILATFLPHTELDLFPTVALPGKSGKTP